MLRASVMEPRLRLRLRVRLRRWRLDHELAGSLSPDGAEDRRLRAQQLLEPAARRRLAGSLREVVSAAEHPAHAILGPAAPVRRQAVLSFKEGLLGLAERLEQPTSVNPAGVARVAVLLSDGLGPLYSARPERSIGEAVWWIADGLQLPPPPPVTGSARASWR